MPFKKVNVKWTDSSEQFEGTVWLGALYKDEFDDHVCTCIPYMIGTDAVHSKVVSVCGRLEPAAIEDVIEHFEEFFRVNELISDVS